MKPNKANNKFLQAFTLVELLVTMTIIAILAAIAYPSYQSNVYKSRRADAKGALLGFANAMERHYTETNSYCDAADEAGQTVDGCGSDSPDKGSPIIYNATSPVDSGSVYYQLSITSVSSNTFTLQAEPVGAQVDDACGRLLISQTGERRIVNQHEGITLDQCW